MCKKIITIKSFAKFYEEIDNLNEELEHLRENPDLVPPARPLYRGHTDSEWTLKTTLERFYEQELNDVIKYNKLLVKVHPAIESYTGEKWGLEINPELPKEFFWGAPPNYPFMINARHHGFPSPLLDWSLSPYVALFFALKTIPSNKDAAVFAYVDDPNGGKIGHAGDARIFELG